MATLQLRETSSSSAPPPPKRTTEGMMRARSRWRLRCGCHRAWVGVERVGGWWLVDEAGCPHAGLRQKLARDSSRASQSDLSYHTIMSARESRRHQRASCCVCTPHGWVSALPPRRGWWRLPRPRRRERSSCAAAAARHLKAARSAKPDARRTSASLPRRKMAGRCPLRSQRI